jgi:uncharacterized DUF497 family protein/uncharacterized protein (DUF4415 family)
MHFEWNAEKARRNLAKHGVSFEDAMLVWDDPHAEIVRDRSASNEERYWAIGQVRSGVLVVVHLYSKTTLSASSAPGRRNDMSEDSTRMVTFDPSKMTDEERAEQDARLERLAAMPDEDIDFSDIPPITDEQWATRRPLRHFRPIKQRVTIRLDADVLDWFKHEAEGGRYQTSMNRALRSYMQEQLRHQPKKRA